MHKRNAVIFDFTGAEVSVAGGSEGIGRAIAETFRDNGGVVTITGATDEASSGVAVHGVSYKTARRSRQDCREGADGGPPSLDILINCAGRARALDEHDPEIFADAVAVNLVGAYAMAREEQERMREDIAHEGRR